MAHPDKSEHELAKDLGLGSAGHVQRVLEKPQVKAFMAYYLDKAGATALEHARVIAEAHNAMEVKVFNHCGTVVESKEYVDHPTRLRAAELGMKARHVLSDPTQKDALSSMLDSLDDNDLIQITLGKKKLSDLVQPGAHG